MKASYSVQKCHGVILSNIFIFTRDKVLKSMLEFYLENLRMENQNHLDSEDFKVGLHLSFFFNKNPDFSGDTVDKSLPVNAGDTGLIADPEKPHMPGATKLVCPTTVPKL